MGMVRLQRVAAQIGRKTLRAYAWRERTSPYRVIAAEILHTSPSQSVQFETWPVRASRSQAPRRPVGARPENGSRTVSASHAGVGRLLRRYLGLEDGSDRLREIDSHVWQAASRLTSGPAAQPVVWGLIDLAREVCRPVPRCHVCPLLSGCGAHRRR